MNELQIFNNENFGQIRTILINNEPYFMLSDVCKILKIKNSRDAKSRLSNKGVANTDILTNGGSQQATFINESNLYKLSFTSRKKEAEKFTDWVTSEVLPTIRKTGGYISNDDMFIDTYLPFVDDNTKLLFKTTLQTVRQQNEIIKKQEKEISYKENIIMGLVDNIDLAEKRQRITQIIRKGARRNYAKRYYLLYSEFEKKFHCDLDRRINNCMIKPKIKNKMDFIDRGLNMIPQLYEIACKLFENDVEKLKKE